MAFKQNLEIMENAERVTELLRENASIWANLGTKNALDLGTMEAAKKRWLEILDEIQQLDEETWRMVTVDEYEYDDDEEDDAECGYGKSKSCE
jgi:hypothetical protein